MNFRIANDSLSPGAYSAAVVNAAIDRSEQALKVMLDGFDPNIEQRILSCSFQVQMHLIALQTATYFICADIVCKSSGEVMEQVDSGVLTGFAYMFDKTGDRSNGMAQATHDLFRDYAASIAVDLSGLSSEKQRRGLGETARLFTSNIAGQCGIEELLATSAKERACIEVCASQFGISHLLNLLHTREVTYSD